MRVEMLGSFQVRGAGTAAISRFRTRQTACLFAYLTLHRGKRLPREILAEMFWPDAPNQEKARASLAVAVSSLRSQLETGQAGQVLLVDPRSLGVRTEAISSDVLEFEQALDRLASDDTPQTIEALRQTLSLFRGTFLPGFYDDWVLGEQARLRDRFITAVRRLGSYFEQEGDIDEAIYWRRQELLHFSEDAGALEHLLQLLTEEERLEEAAQVYHDATRRWKDEGRGTLPHSVWQRAQRALEIYPTPTQKTRPRRPIPATPVAEEPVRAVLPVSLPPLPLEITRFVGREAELSQLNAFVEQADGRLLTLIGPGGIGKTRLAIEAAHQLQQAGGSAYFVALQNTHQEQDFLLALASSLQIRLPAGPDADPLETICYLLSQRPRPVLVLDNMEQLLETDAIACLGRLLQRVPLLCCIATSQTRLSIPGERLFPVSPLPIPSPEAILTGIKNPVAFEAAWPSVALFVDRARESMPDFHLHARNLKAVGNIALLLEGLPLALLLAAARVQVMPPAKILEGVQERFRLLSTTRRSGPERHRSLHASISWSYDLLRPELQQFFVQLTVFCGSFSNQDVESVLQSPLALDYLAELCDSSFLTTEVSEQHVRFAMLESLRLFGAQQWEPSEREALRQRHATHFAHLADQARSHWRTDQEPLWMERLQNDLENLRAALRWSLESEDSAHLDAAYQLGSSLGRFWWINIYHKEGQEYLSQILQKEKLCESLTAEQLIRLKISLISQLIVSGELIKAKSWCQEALSQALKSDNKTLYAIISSNLGAIEIELSNWNEGITHINNSTAIFLNQKDYMRLITIFNNMSDSFIKTGDLQSAIKFAYKKYKFSVRRGTNSDVTSSIQSLADCIFLSKTPHDSMKLYEKSITGNLLSHNIYDLTGSLLCYSLLNYTITKSETDLLRIIYILNFKKLSGSTEGPVSSIFATRHKIKIIPMGIGSAEDGKNQLRKWAEEITDDQSEITDIEIRNIVKKFVSNL
nr:AAA family ATPase [Armatimonas sp.]